MRLLQPDPKARFATAAESKRALVAALKPSFPYRWPLAWAAGAAALALVAVFGLRARPKPVPSKPALQSPVPTKQAAPPIPEPPVERPAANLPEPVAPAKQQLAAKPEKLQSLAKKKAAARAFMPKAKAMREKGRSGAQDKRDERDWPSPSNQADSPSQQALPPGLLKLQDSGPPQTTSPGSDAKPAGKSGRKSMGTKGGWNDDFDFGPTKK
jgi:hypothetical protein